MYHHKRSAYGAGAALAALALVAPATALEPDPAATRAIMREVFEALQQSLPASLDEESFRDPARREEIGRALQTLATHSERVANHGSRAGEDFAFLSRSLARDARDAERRFAGGYPSEARFLLHGIVENCAACHSRLPDPEDARLPSRILDEQALAELELPERATLAVATRQFEDALEAMETMFASTRYDAGSIELMGHLEDYLEITLQVKNEPKRAARTLRAFSEREDVRPGLDAKLARWIEDLEQLAERGPVEGLPAAREMVERAEAATPHLGERAELVRYVAAAGALHRFLATLESGDSQAAEAYYWLGVVESRIGRSFWLSQTEAYLEASIRLAPAGPFADDAYAVLEEFVVLGYTGSSGEHVPPEVQGWLDELRRLIAKSREGDAA